MLFADPVISSLATWYRKTSDQIILRWQLQSGNPVIAGSFDEARITEYLDVLNFSLTGSDMEQINALDRTPMFVYY